MHIGSEEVCVSVRSITSAIFMYKGHEQRKKPV